MVVVARQNLKFQHNPEQANFYGWEVSEGNKIYIQEVRTKLSSTTLMKAVTKCNMLILGIYSNTLSRFKIAFNCKNIEYFLAEHSKFTGLFV